MKGIFLRKRTSDLGHQTSVKVWSRESEVQNLCVSASLREAHDPAVCFEKAIKCDPLEYWAVLERMLDVVDLFLYDLKYMDAEKHRDLTGADNTLADLAHYRRPLQTFA